ncbi:MAG: S9 family peptidase [Planctomycetaceae bacterium]|nr:S9 family peptidase [Planctomycetaceae bacterium]
MWFFLVVVGSLPPIHADGLLKDETATVELNSPAAPGTCDATAPSPSETTRQVKQPMQPDDPARSLTVDRIFTQDEFQEEKISPIVWSKLGGTYFTLKQSGKEAAGQSLVRIDAASGTETIVVSAEGFMPPGESKPLAIDGFAFSTDESKLLIYTNSRRVWRHNTRGDYWILDISTRDLKKLGGDASPSTLMFAKFSPDGTRVAYVRENNLYVQDVRSRQITALTTDGSAKIINGTADWVNEEELGLRDGYRWSPDSNSIAFWSFDTTGVEDFHLIDYTQGTYPRLTSFPYPKVGMTNSASRLGVVPAAGGAVRWLALPGDPREYYLPQMEWFRDGSALLIQQMNRLQNVNCVWRWDLNTGAIETVLSETDAAWLENENPIRWLKQAAGFLWLSERSGWRHAYRASADGQEFSAITAGPFDVMSVEAIDEARGVLYFAASPDNPTQRDLYRVPLGGGQPERLSPVNQPGWHTYEVSPDAQWAIHRCSTFTTPPVVELIRLPDHSVVRVLTDNARLREKLATLHRPAAEFFRVEIGDGLLLDGWCLKPPSMNPSSKYPLLFHVYGEPHGQTVRDAWQGSRGLWHWMLAQQGYLVASVDNRGTNAPRGRAWRKCVHRQIGILAPEEQAAATRALLKQWSFADSSRVGIWGWSGGGSMSLNALFRYPDLYHTAIAVAPNADQRLYDTIYQERYMGLPADNVDGYRLGSPITHAPGLTGNLLLVHGTGDDNGHYQGTEKLINELIAHHKRFTVMPYPARSHAISEGRNTVPHFYSLMTDYLRVHLLAQKKE